ncbi:transcription antitermination factor NusG [Pedobacter cryoconitis]|uniref:Transcription antitermination factor NusG n=1 Tax=Pedobacter cryoconitis TaxID=188932 RepID=A0A7W8ZJI6_9SPHI|nr:UpxY family transcription antiterminator [Pedobacter cryoconitis]MBB5635118.1 transcription antitermination factor NusG [Pedobacter cryoconitis]MBB6271698.1 transcription antitermination factor NusG [Pedobacter cryoconitis]
MINIRSFWCVLYTRTNFEKKIANELKRKGIAVFLPTVKLLKQWSDRKKIIDSPLFPSYLFVKIDYKEQLFDALSTDGALYVIKSGKEISMVRESLIEELKIISSYGDSVEVFSNIFEPGEKVVVNKGPFKGLICEIVKHNSKLKVLVRIDMLNRSILATLPLSDDSLVPNRTVVFENEMS